MQFKTSYLEKQSKIDYYENLSGLFIYGLDI